MRLLSPSLLTAQKETSREALWKLVLSKTGEDTLTYEADRIKFLQWRGGESNQTAQLLLDNTDHEFRDKNLKGYQGLISMGCVTPNGDEYSQEAPLWVLFQQLYSLQTGKLSCSLVLGGLMNLLGLDKASAVYEPESGDTRTIKDWLIEIISLTDTSAESTEEQTTRDSDMPLYSGLRVYAGQKLTISNRRVTKLALQLRKVGSPTGDIALVVSRTSDGVILAGKTWGDANSLSTAYGWVEVTLDPPITIDEEVIIQCQFLHGDSSNYIDLSYNASSVKASEALAWYLTSWNDEATYDAVYRYSYSPTPITSFSHCTSIGLVFDSEDSIIDSYQPQDSIRLAKGQTRKALAEMLLGWTGCVWRAESDGKIHIFVPKKDTSTTWAANTAYKLRDEIIPTTANGYVYICTTAGTSHASTEPTFPTGIGDTVIDGTVVWTVAYDYEYELAEDDAGKHTFYDKSHNKRLVMPSKITVDSRSTDSPSYSGSAETSDHSSRPENLQKQDFIELRISSDAQGVSIAGALIAKLERDAETGSARLPMNVGAEVLDFCVFVDEREDRKRNGVIRQITKTCKAGDEGGTFEMQVRFGLVAGEATLGVFPTSTEPINLEMNFLLLVDHMKFIDQNIDLLFDNYDTIDGNEKLNRAILQSIFASIVQTTAAVEIVKAITPHSLGGSIYGQRVLVFALNGSTALTTDDKAYQRIPLAMDGFKLTRAAAMVKGASSSGAITLTVKNGATSMLSTDITIDQDEFDTLTAATPPVVDENEDDVSTGDQIEVAVSGAGTGVTYCVVELTFTKDV